MTSKSRFRGVGRKEARDAPNPPPPGPDGFAFVGFIKISHPVGEKWAALYMKTQ